ncbi:ABC transporter permease [Spiribacter vilamensis]|uniref:Putative thiamine transport system permease protein n=1 Tax=Spiribacter vilamensis TaxID=531306 RepID=A0A4Q8CZ73_9GAMM|nr:ABC transporter permease [Spiribacter vilamensis]RZU98303.1 putative thiamine transport system permease protein [Spiribacter vilamensis]TVO60806.1 ABC transporter permease [Spiribacter vilamensis]
MLLRTGLRTLVIAVIIGPVLLGVTQTLTAAFGWLPALGERSIGVAPWVALLDRPGLVTSIQLTVWTGIAATIVGFALAFAFVAGLYGTPAGRRLTPLLAPFLATPHAAIAIGLAFIIAPSGWLFRLLAEPLQLSQPPSFALVGDPMGIGLILGLLLKEIPFLALVMTASLGHLPVRRWLIAARSLGYSNASAWLRVVLPRLWPHIRLPTLIVLSYALSNVDMALLLGPSNPPVLAVVVLRLYTDPALSSLLTAGAGALLQAGLVMTAFAGVWLMERLITVTGRIWLRRGGRDRFVTPLLAMGRVGVRVLFALGGMAITALLVWSVTWRWPWPQRFPEQFSLAAWRQSGNDWTGPFGHSLLFAGITTIAALVLAIAWLETERRGRSSMLAGIVYLPLLLPQIGFLPGLQFGFLQLGIDAGILAVSWAHLLFVFPYVLLVLVGPWRGFDPMLTYQAASLGAGPLSRLLRVKLPVLIGPILAAIAIGVAVSIAQYLPTLIMGAGRLSTLTTEAVSLASGADRRITAVYAMLQTLIPLLVYTVAIITPIIRARNRRFLRE